MKILIPMCVVLAGLATACSSHQEARKSTSSAPPKATAKVAPEEARTTYPVIGFLAGRDDVITIKAGPQGPLYSVTTKDGRVLYQDLSAEQLQAKAPDIFRIIKGSVANDARLRFPEVKMQVIDNDRLDNSRFR
jgi:hypothetical protein